MASLVAFTAGFSARPRATLFLNASAVHTMDDDHPTADAWCVINGRIGAIGAHAAAARACGPAADVVNLRGAVVVPGFIDSHLHLLYGGFKLLRPQLDNCSSAQDVVSMLEAHVRANPQRPGAWLRGFGWDQERFESRELPTRQLLDAAFPHTPVWLERIDGHAGWCNGAALRLVPPLPSTDPPGGRIVRDAATGMATGVLTDTAMRLVANFIPVPPREEQRQASLPLMLILASIWCWRHSSHSFLLPCLTGVAVVPVSP